MESMRLKHELKQVEVPQSLILSNNSTKEIDDIIQKKTVDTVSPETLSYRLQRGWQHLQEFPDPFLNNNNNSGSSGDLNDNVDDVIRNPPPSPMASSVAHVDAGFEDDYRHGNMTSDDSGSSSEDESSTAYSDTSPLLDVSSLGDSLDSDMSEDSSSSSETSSSSSGSEANNNNEVEVEEEEEEEEEEGEARSMQSSWMSFSSAASSPSVAEPSSSSRSQVVLPDVLPVGRVSRDEEEPMSEGSSSRNVEITFEKKRRPSQDSAVRDRCLVEISTQPDIQVDIRLNPVHPSRMSVKHGNTYPREAKSNKRYLKSRPDATWIVNDSFEEDSSTPRYWALGEGIRLNNFTIVNGFKTLSLTELVNPEITCNSESQTDEPSSDTIATDNFHFQDAKRNTVTDSYQNFDRMYSKSPATNVHMCCKDNWRFQKGRKLVKQPSLDSSSNCAPVGSVIPQAPPLQQLELQTSAGPQKPLRSNLKEPPETSKSSVQSPPLLPERDDNCNTFASPDELVVKPKDSPRSDVPSYIAKVKSGETKLASPELFEVYTMETALPHINWAAISKGSRESDWIRKRRNDREEIRRKLAMDSDTEDYISEKLSQHKENGSSFSRLKGSGNLQICFMNEAAKDQDLPTSENSDGESVNKIKPSVPKIQKTVLQLPSSNLPKCDKVASKPSTNSSMLSVTKRQRPKFFFNRPRSWHASKPEQKPFPEEDLLTRHVRLQAEAREALAQAKEMARMQMEIERQKKKKSPIAEMVGLQFPDSKNQLTHHALALMNVAQLQVIVNDLHSQIETLNEDLVKFLLERDDLHMEQDSKLVDIEDLTKYLGLKGTNGVSMPNSQACIPSSSSTSNKKAVTTESVRRSQSVHLKSKNLM